MRRSFLFVAIAGLALANQAWGQNCSFNIEANDQMQFNLKEIRVSKSCKEVTVNLKHVGMLAANLMGHNWVLSPTPDFQAVAQAGQGAGAAANYVPAGDKRVIASTTVIGGGQQTSVKFDISGLTPGGDYTYFCSFPPHFVLMNGKFIIE